MLVLEAFKESKGMNWTEYAEAVVDAAKAHGINLPTIDPRTVSRVAKGQQNPGPKLQRALERAWGKPIDVLLSPYDPATPLTDSGSSSGLLTSHQQVLREAANRAREFSFTMPQLQNLSDIEEELRDLAVDYPVKPLIELINPLTSLQTRVFDIIESPRAPADGRQLFGLAGLIGGILAKASHDLGDPRSASSQAFTAYRCADEADSDAIRAWVCGLQSLIYYWDSKAKRSVDFARKGQQYARGTHMAVWLAASEARGEARLGNADAATTAIHSAQDALDAARSTYLDDFGGMLTFGPARTLYYAADAFAWMPGHDEAENYATAAVQAYSDPAEEEWAFGDAAGARCDLAIVRINAGELEGAAEAVAPVLDLPTEQRIGGIIKSVQRVQDSLRYAPDTAVRDELHDELETFTLTPLRMLP